MKILRILFFCSLFQTAIYCQNVENGKDLFDFDWRFHRGGALGAEIPEFNDSSWRLIDLPHDWSIEDLPNTESPFNPAAISQVNGGFTIGGTGWYRKAFSISENEKGKLFHLQFDGVYMNADFWLNGIYLGNHPYGYTSFWFDITDELIYGGNNILSVKVKNEGENSRWYSGSGIYRHVWLETLNPIHFTHWGTFISTLEVNGGYALMNLTNQVKNETKKAAQIKVVHRIIAPEGKEVSHTESECKVNEGDSYEIKVNIKIKSPELWSTESPVLYKVISEIYQNDNIRDSRETTFGIRTIEYSVNNGFQLNGKTIKLRGGCLHHDNGPLGAKAFDRSEERRIELLKKSGFNSIRSSHNPPSTAFLDACDRIGMLVIDEAFDMWRVPKNLNDYNLYFDEWWRKDIESMVNRDRNHPSIIMWSTGNEIPDMHKSEVVKVSQMLSDYIRNIDSTRPVTAAVNDLKPDKDPFFSTLEVSGYNYGTGGDHNNVDLYAHDHFRIPNRIMYSSESYPLVAFETWMEVLENPYVIGDFVWTAIDYIGEASIGWRGYWQEANFYPWNLAYCGDIDICGWKRPQSYYRDALWSDNQLSLFVNSLEPSFEINQNRVSWSKWHWPDVVADWNWEGYENKELEVNVYSSCDEVELILNNKSLGRKPTNRSTKYISTWKVPYQPGKLLALGYDNKKQIKVSELETASEPKLIRLSADRTEIISDGQDLSYITVEVTDKNGILAPKAENLIKFEIEGPGSIIAVGNANPISLESYQLPQRKAWRGKCLVIVKSQQMNGDITLKALSHGLTGAEVKIKALR